MHADTNSSVMVWSDQMISKYFMIIVWLHTYIHKLIKDAQFTQMRPMISTNVFHMYCDMCMVGACFFHYAFGLKHHEAEHH